MLGGSLGNLVLDCDNCPSLTFAPALSSYNFFIVGVGEEYSSVLTFS